jgi:hypothetical protein
MLVVLQILALPGLRLQRAAAAVVAFFWVQGPAALVAPAPAALGQTGLAAAVVVILQAGKVAAAVAAVNMLN